MGVRVRVHHPYDTTPVHSRSKFWKIGASRGPERSCGVMIVEAASPHRLHSTFIIYVEKVFYNLDMLWMDIRGHRKTCAVSNFGESGQDWPE